MHRTKNGVALFARGVVCRRLPVYYTRRRPDGSIMRSRQCRNCGKLVTTYERRA